jgi:hypothetical protein
MIQGGYMLFEGNGYGEFIKSPRTCRCRDALEGKFFAENPEHAIAWGEALEGAGHYRIVEVELTASVSNALMRWTRLDDIGPARYANLSQLESATIRQYEL